MKHEPSARVATRASIPATVTIRVQLRLAKVGGRKRVIAPDGALPSIPLSPMRVDNTVLKALARAYRWQSILEGGEYNSLTELARAEKINPSYLARVLRLTLLAPSCVEAVLGGRATPPTDLGSLMRGFPTEWHRQVH